MINFKEAAGLKTNIQYPWHNDDFRDAVIHLK